MKQDDDRVISVAIKKGEALYRLLKENKVDSNSVFKLILDTNNYERQIMNQYLLNQIRNFLIQHIFQD